MTTSPNPHTSQQLNTELLHDGRRFFLRDRRPNFNRTLLSAPYPTPDTNPAPDRLTLPLVTHQISCSYLAPAPEGS